MNIRFATQYNIQLLCNLFELVQLRGGTQYNIHLLMQLVQMRGGTQYSIICHVTCADEGCNTVQYATCADEGWNTVCRLE